MCSPVNLRNAAEIERAVVRLSHACREWRPDRDGRARDLRFIASLIVALAVRHKLPAVYSVPQFRRRMAA